MTKQTGKPDYMENSGKQDSDTKKEKNYENEGKKRIDELRDIYSKSRDEEKLAKILFYGSWGTYKTSYAMSMPRDILLMSFDPGGEKIFHVQKGVDDGSIVVDNRWASRTMEDSKEKFKGWNDEYNKMKQQGVFEEVNTLVIDSLTTFQRFVIDATIESNNKNKKMSKYMPFKVPQMRDYNVQHSAIEFIVSDMLDLPCHVVIIAHSEEGQDDDTNLFYCRPLIIGAKLRERLPMLFDEIYISRQKGNSTELLTAPKNVYKARSRLRKLSKGIEDSYKLDEPSSFSFSRDILLPAGYCTEEEVVTLESFPED